MNLGAQEFGDVTPGLFPVPENPLIGRVSNGVRAAIVARQLFWGIGMISSAVHHYRAHDSLYWCISMAVFGGCAIDRMMGTERFKLLERDWIAGGFWKRLMG